jgi:uncharacterized protein YdeI (YjbR/CyaY-like superfamily)
MMPKPQFFASPLDFRNWLIINHEKKAEILVGFHKVGSGKKSISWSESVDQALCFGWIDGIRKSIDEESYCIRFTPRKATSIWSAVNIKKAESLRAAGHMHPAGSSAFEKRKEHKSKIYEYENKPAILDKAYEKRLKASKKALTFLKSMPGLYQRLVIHWVMTAKQESTRLRRLETLILDSEAGRKVKPYRY